MGCLEISASLLSTPLSVEAKKLGEPLQVSVSDATQRLQLACSLVCSVKEEIITKPYTELEYIESTGTQYIDTEVKLTNNHSVAVDYQLTEAMQNRKGIFGVLVSNMTARFGAILSPSNSYLEFGYGAGNMYWQYGLPDTNRHYYEQRQHESYFDGVLVYTFASATFSTGVNAPLGNFTFTNYNPAKAKYFGAKIWDGSSLIRNFVPVLDSDGVVCMYDLVSETFFYNKGTGDFIAGPEI